MARKYARDNRGRFASRGGGATARGGRLKTASGKKRATQTMQADGAKSSGAIKGRVKRDPAAAGKIGAAKPTSRKDQLAAGAKIGLQATSAAAKPVSSKGARLGGSRRTTNAAAPKNTTANRTGQSKTLNRFNSRPVGTMVAGKGINLVPSTKRVPLDIQGKRSDEAFARMATKSARVRARSVASRIRKVDLSQAAFESRASKTEKRARAAEKAVQGADRSNPRSRRAFNRADALRSAADSYSSLARRGRTGDLSAATLFQGRSRQSTAPKLTRSQKATATRQANKERKFYEQMKAAERARRS